MVHRNAEITGNGGRKPAVATRLSLRFPPQAAKRPQKCTYVANPRWSKRVSNFLRLVQSWGGHQNAACPAGWALQLLGLHPFRTFAEEN